MEKADQQKLPYEIKVLNPVTVVNIDYIDLIRLISIALNNALEHYSSDEDAPIQILIDQTPEQFYFKISNPAHMTGVSLGEILKRGYSSKKMAAWGCITFRKSLKNIRMPLIKYDMSNHSLCLN